MTERWSDMSRLGTLRIYVRKDTTLTILCHGVDSYAFSMDADKNVTSVDPTGGPYLGIGSIIQDKWVITRIQSHYKKYSIAKFVFELSSKN
jgi:hypothetical protein